MNNKPEIIIYQAQNGLIKIDVLKDSETVWLTQMQMAELYKTTKQNVSLHINNILKDGELSASATVKEYLTVQNEDSREIKRYINILLMAPQI